VTLTWGFGRFGLNTVDCVNLTGNKADSEKCQSQIMRVTTMGS